MKTFGKISLFIIFLLFSGLSMYLKENKSDDIVSDFIDKESSVLVLESGLINNDSHEDYIIVIKNNNDCYELLIIFSNNNTYKLELKNNKWFADLCKGDRIVEIVPNIKIQKNRFLIAINYLRIHYIYSFEIIDEKIYLTNFHKTSVSGGGAWKSIVEIDMLNNLKITCSGPVEDDNIIKDTTNFKSELIQLNNNFDRRRVLDLIE